MALYAGQTAGLVRDVLPAAAILDELVSGAAEALGRMSLRPRSVRQVS
jgi:NAD(P)H-dependent flavin oxidoreductase YrpB (nitropropane dioxygenase family)